MKITGVLATAGIALAVGLGGASLAAGQGHAGDQAQISQLRGQVAQLQGQLAGVRGSVNGEHRDLITCGDLQVYMDQLGDGLSAWDYLQQINGNGGTTLINTGPSALPQHCINQ